MGDMRRPGARRFWIAVIFCILASCSLYLHLRGDGANALDIGRHRLQSLDEPCCTGDGESLDALALRRRCIENGRRLLEQTGSGRPSSLIPADRVLLYRALKAVNDSSELVYFNGPRVKDIFDRANKLPHYLLHDKLLLKSWKTVAQAINTTFLQQQQDQHLRTYRAVHVHNELKVGDLLLTILEEYRRNRMFRFPKSPAVVEISTRDLHQTMDMYQPPIVMTNTVDENWGFLSTVIANRTTKWINMTNHLLIHYCDHSTLRKFLDSDKIVLVVASSHVDPALGYHRKVISLPLGIKARQFIFTRARMYLGVEFRKTKLLTINNSGWGPRAAINELVSRAFNYTVQNAYSRKTRPLPTTFRMFNSTEEVILAADHHLDIAQSKFVLCPSGLGWDTYRLWEVLLMGSIPVVETNPGLDRTVASLPVLIVRGFAEVTPALLERAYACFVAHAYDFDFSHLREDYWLRVIAMAQERASVEHLMEHHPFRHKYCDFLR